MLHRSRLIVFVTIVAAAVLASPPLAGAEGAHHNHVTMVNRTDEHAAAKGRAVLSEDSGPTVDAENTAFARASCTDCRTVAVAIQVVAVEGPVSDFHPLNAAVALNERCTRCQTYAYARQEVIAIDDDFELSSAGRDALRSLKASIRRVAASDEPFLEMGAELDGLTAKMVDVVRGEIDRAGRRERSHSARRDEDVRD